MKASHKPLSQEEAFSKIKGVLSGSKREPIILIAKNRQQKKKLQVFAKPKLSLQ
jgi:hypothetical protein